VGQSEAPVAKEDGGAPAAGITSDTGLYSYDLAGKDDDEDEDGYPETAALTEPHPESIAKELAAFRRFARARRKQGAWRDFGFEHVAAGEAARLNAEGFIATRKAASGYELSPRSGMVSLDLPPGTVRPVPGGVGDHHVTVVYLGPDVDDEAFAAACDRARQAAALADGPLSGTVSGVGAFPPSPSSDGKVPAWAAIAIPGAEVLREALADLSASEHANWTPHVTLAYIDAGDPLPAPLEPVPVTFTHLSVHRGDDVERFPLGGEPVAKAGGAGPKDWPGWALDLATASYWSPKVTAAARQALSRQQLDAIASAYAADHPGQDGSATGKRERNAAAVAWLKSQGVTVPMGDVAQGIAADSVLIGGASAQAAANGNDTADTQGWTPGNTAAAGTLAAGLGLGELHAAVTGSGGAGEGERPYVAGDMEDGYLGVTAGVLAGWDDGTPDDELAGALDDAVGDGDYAQGLTLNQVLTVMGLAALQWYLANGTASVSWQTTPGACSLCLANEAAGPVPAGTAFPSGALSVPGHPHCRCAIVQAR
jgi:2'-5' RNA ligase